MCAKLRGVRALAPRREPRLTRVRLRGGAGQVEDTLSRFDELRAQHQAVGAPCLPAAACAGARAA